MALAIHFIYSRVRNKRTPREPPGTNRVNLKALTFIFLQAFKCAYVMLLMATFWVTEALPLAITSLIPVAILPLFGK